MIKKDEIKELLENSDTNVRALDMKDFSITVINILQQYTEKLVEELNKLQNMAIKDNKSEVETIKLLSKLFNTMLNAAVPEALEYVMTNLPEIIGLDDDDDDDMSECDGVA